MHSGKRLASSYKREKKYIILISNTTIAA